MQTLTALAALDPATLTVVVLVVLAVAMRRPTDPVTGACTTLDLRTKSVSDRCRTVVNMLD